MPGKNRPAIQRYEKKRRALSWQLFWWRQRRRREPVVLGRREDFEVDVLP